MQTITITDLLIRPTIGLYELERALYQDIYLDISIEYKRSSFKDDISTTIDYVPLVEWIHRLEKTIKPRLIETLASHIVDYCLTNQLVSKVSVTVKKPAALTSGLAAVTVTKSK